MAPPASRPALLGAMACLLSARAAAFVPGDARHVPHAQVVHRATSGMPRGSLVGRAGTWSLPLQRRAHLLAASGPGAAQGGGEEGEEANFQDLRDATPLPIKLSEVIGDWAIDAEANSWTTSDPDTQGIMKATKSAIDRMRVNIAAGQVRYGFGLSTSALAQDMLAVATVKTNGGTPGPETLELVTIDEVVRRPTVDREFNAETKIIEMIFQWAQLTDRVPLVAPRKEVVDELLEFGFDINAIRELDMKMRGIGLGPMGGAGEAAAPSYLLALDVAP